MKKKKIKGKIIYIVLLVVVAIIASIGTVFAQKMIASIDVSYSTEISGLESSDVQGAIDELYVKCANVPTFASYLQSLAVSDTVIKDDGTADHNMRYTGKTPNNYVTFEGEEWRVIGVFNNIDNGTGKTATRVKIIKSTSFVYMKIDSDNINIWKSSDLNIKFQESSYASSRLVANAVWYLGDPGGDYTYTAAQAYTYERGTTVAEGNDPTWTGKVGLMYPSDYGFASSACKDGSKTLRYYDATCASSDWLFITNDYLMSPISDTTTHFRRINHVGWLDIISVNDTVGSRPVVYLKSTVTCKNCNESDAGTKENPFQLA